MKKIHILLIIIALISTSCTEKETIKSDVEVQNFIWKGLNAYYLWQSDVPNLQDNRFSNQNDLNRFLKPQNPENLFESLLFERNKTDKWSWIVEDYIALEKSFQGISKTNGMRFGLVELYKDSNEIFGYVQYIIPNSNAESLGVTRGFIIYGIDGQQLTKDNYEKLLSKDQYTVNFGTYTKTDSTVNVLPNDINITLTKTELDVNPIHAVKIHDISGHKIGYIMYNQFARNYDTQLNTVFSQFKAEHITDLVLDLRYNGGGSVQTAIHLASMITGQFTNELFAKERWNAKWQSYFEAGQSEFLENNFTDTLTSESTISHLNLDKVTIIVTGRSASASELVISGLQPYITVDLVGTQTHGKYVGSVTLYDSNSYRRGDSSLNQNHHYAMQPIVLEMVNKLGLNNKEGYIPKKLLHEDYANLGELGDPSEPLFALAIQNCLNLKMSYTIPSTNQISPFTDSEFDNPLSSDMYIDLK